MLLVIPIAPSDIKSLPTLQKSLDVFPPGVGHDLLIVTYPTVAVQAQAFAESVQRLFRSTTVHRAKSDYPFGWPMEMNMLFQYAAMESARILKQGECWMWFEVDTTPVAPNWLSALHTAYYADALPAEKERREPKRFFGNREPVIRSMNGERMDHTLAGEMMAAVGIYPANFSTISAPLLKVLPQNTEPFYQFLQWYVVNSLADTDLIQNNRETINYRDGQCDSIARNAWDVHWNKPINPNALVVHGCKDGSLLEMILGKKQEPAPIVHQDSTPKAPPLPPASTSGKRELSAEERQRRSDRMKAMLAKKRAEKSEPVTV